MREKEYWYWLSTIEGFWQGKIKKLLNDFHEPKEIYEAGEELLLKVGGLSRKDLGNIIMSRKNRDFFKELEELEKRKIHFFFYNGEGYPKRLENIYDPPFYLFVSGELPSEEEECIGVIGARNCSEYGKWMGEQIGYSIAKAGAQLISGLAKGIDAHSQWGAIRGGGRCYLFWVVE
jgi:DNA processing protein